MLNASISSHKFVEIVLPRTYPGYLELPIVPEESRPTAIAASAHTLKDGAFGRRFKAILDPVIVHFMDLIRRTPQAMVGSPRSMQAVAALAPAKQDHFFAYFIELLIKLKWRNMLDGRCQLYHGQINRIMHSSKVNGILIPIVLFPCWLIVWIENGTRDRVAFPCQFDADLNISGNVPGDMRCSEQPLRGYQSRCAAAAKEVRDAGPVGWLNDAVSVEAVMPDNHCVSILSYFVRAANKHIELKRKRQQALFI